MDPFELLKADHKKVAELFDRLEAGTGKAKLATFKQIKKELEVHTHIEEKIFYPALESPKETHDLTLEAYEEHNVVKSLSQLAKGRKADDEWQAKAKVLRENVEHHVKEEENELFDKASDAIESDQLETLGDEMAAEKARREGKPKPKTKVSKGKVGIISRLASLIGLGGDSTAVKKPAKKAAKKSGSKSTKKATKTAAKKTSTKATAEAVTKSSRTTKSQKP